MLKYHKEPCSYELHKSNQSMLQISLLYTKQTNKETTNQTQSNSNKTKPNLNNTGKTQKKPLPTKLQQNTNHNHRTRNKRLNMRPREPRINYKHRHPNQKGQNYTSINHQGWMKYPSNCIK